MFDRILNFFFRFFVYRGVRKKYGLSKEFRFNGYFIRIYGKGKIYTGKNSYISFFSSVNLSEGTSLWIGDNVSISHNVKIYTSDIDSKELILNGKKVAKRKDVSIGNNVLIGANTFICAGVNIGNNVIIGANSVVTSSLESDAVYAGSPAKLIKKY